MLVYFFWGILGTESVSSLVNTELNCLFRSKLQVVILEAQPEGLSGKTKGNRLLRPCTVLPRIQRHCLAHPPKVQLR